MGTEMQCTLLSSWANSNNWVSKGKGIQAIHHINRKDFKELVLEKEKNKGVRENRTKNKTEKENMKEKYQRFLG